jgi:hypothetical protein
LGVQAGRSVRPEDFSVVEREPWSWAAGLDRRAAGGESPVGRRTWIDLIRVGTAGAYRSAPGGVDGAASHDVTDLSGLAGGPPGVAVRSAPDGQVVGELGMMAAHLDHVTGRQVGERELDQHVAASVEPEVVELDAWHW